MTDNSTNASTVTSSFKIEDVGGGTTAAALGLDNPASTKVITGDPIELETLSLQGIRIGVPQAHFHDLIDPVVEQAFAQALVESADKVEGLKVKVDPDLEKACGVFMDAGEPVGLIIVPQKDITPENESSSGKSPAMAGRK